MPSATLKSLAKKADVSLERAEHLWDKAKEIVNKEYKSFPEKGKKSDRHWALVVGIVKKMLGLKGHSTFKEMLDCEREVQLTEEELEEERKKAAVGTKFNQGLVQVSPDLMKKLSKIPSAYNLAKSATVGPKTRSIKAHNVR